MMEPERQEDERRLLADLRRGQSHAFEQVMRRHNRLLFRTARGIVHDDAEAQDVVQESWLRAFLAVGGFRGEASLATWLTRIVINQALMQQRRLGRVVHWDDATGDAENEMQSDPFSGAQAASPEEEVARLELRRRLSDAVELLPPIYRTVFMLRAVHGVAVEETAAALQVSQDVVKTRFLRARALVRQRLGTDAEGEAPSLHDFAGQRCEDVVASVMAELRARGVVRDQ